ncbi:winged helix-turn-helix domain-containing protein [Nocardioides rubriscoriae]|uniref:winged helix-turn-helix domain-containing protein n=1 Tax=Nocardioides rubriscoriae TaxID=642762 RepID=UPI001FE3E5BC|nr:helix-turn-helix domain-containing protein [Nocardioides rubriscoriae]
MADPMHLRDPQVLRAIAHPMRNRILNELSAQGPMRAADVARTLDVPANQASFHLRQLAKYGLVEEDPAAARDRRDRVWRAVSDSGFTINIEEIEAAPGGPAAADVFRRTASAWAQYVVQQAYEGERVEGTLRTVGDVPVRLTRDEARQLAAEVTEVLDRWVTRTRDDRSVERRTYLFLSALQPYPERPGAVVPPTDAPLDAPTEAPTDAPTDAPPDGE